MPAPDSPPTCADDALSEEPACLARGMSAFFEYEHESAAVYMAHLTLVLRRTRLIA